MQICIGQVCKYPYLKLLQIYLFRPSLKILGDLGLSLLMRNGKSPSALDTSTLMVFAFRLLIILHNKGFLSLLFLFKNCVCFELIFV